MSRSDSENFKRLKREHARLHTPVARKSSVKLIPLEGNRRTHTGAATKKEKILETEKGGAPVIDLPLMVDEPSTGLGKSEPQSPPALSIESSIISHSIDLFQDQTFEVIAPRAGHVALLWRKQSGGEQSRVVMDAQRENRFDTTITIDDGEYLFGYEIDGRVAPDPRYAQKLFLCGHGVFAPLKLARYTLHLTLHNNAEKSDLLVRLDSDADWLVPDTYLLLPAQQTFITTLRLLPSKITQGMNSAALYVSVCRDGTEVAQLAQTIRVNIEAMCTGVLPELIYYPTSFGALMQGKEDAHLMVEVQARGCGVLNGMIALAHSGEMIDLQLEADSEPTKFTHHFTIDSINLPCRDEGQVKIKLITDSYLSNRRLYQADIPYRLIYLKKSLPVLNFGKLISGSNKTIRLEVTRSDGQEVELFASVPETITRYVEFYEARTGVYLFRFNAEGIQPGTSVNEEVMLQDRRSGLQTRIKLMTEIMAHHVEAVQEVSR
ncbi:MAG TPA: hypothetical protein VF543_05735 [Pyrinomonadaceae bacterium]